MDGKISNLCQITSLRRYELTDGNERGLKVLDCDNGKIRFLLNESKALDMMQFFHEGQNISYVSKNGFSLRETEFINRFEGGMLYTCGLDSIGEREGFEFHGTLHNMPAKVTRAECNENGIFVEAEIYNTALFGKNLMFKRKIFTAVGSDCVEISDTLINCGHRNEYYCLLYHVNVGYPMLDSGAHIVADVENVACRTPWSNINLAKREEITEPVPNQDEMCYFLKLKEPKFKLINEKLGKTLTLSYSGDTLPNFVQWKSMASGDYALGMEPATTELDGAFTYKTIQAGEKINFSISLQFDSIH